MLLDAVIVFALLLAFIYAIFLRGKTTSKNRIFNTPLTVLFAIQVFFIIWSYYILKTSEGFDGMLVILTAPPAIILSPIILILGHYQHKNNINKSLANTAVVFVNAVALAGLLLSFVYFSYFVTE